MADPCERCGAHGRPAGWKYCETCMAEKYGYSVEKAEISHTLSSGDPIFEDVINKCREIFNAKGHDYRIGNEDRLHNFITCAELLGLKPEQIWGVYFYKHVAAVFAWCKTGKVESEGIEGRFHDIINYAILGSEIARRFK